MSDSWYRGGVNPLEFDGAPFMETIAEARVDVATYLMTHPRPATRFQEVEEALFSQELPTFSSLAVAKALQYDFDRRGNDVTEDDLRSACARLDAVDGDIKGRQHIIGVDGERFIACLGSYSLQGSVRPVTVTLQLFDPSIQREGVSLKRVQRVKEAYRIPVWSVEQIWAYER